MATSGIGNITLIVDVEIISGILILCRVNTSLKIRKLFILQLILNIRACFLCFI